MTGPNANIFTQANADGSTFPSGINVVIGMADGSFTAPTFRTRALNGPYSVNGQGSVSLIAAPPTLPALSTELSPGINYVQPPTVGLVHELIHAAHGLSGGRSSGTTTYQVAHPGGTWTLDDPTEEVLTVGGANLAAQANGVITANGQTTILPNQAMAVAALAAWLLQGSYQQSAANNGLGQNPGSIAELRTGVWGVSENSYNADVGLIQRPYYGELDPDIEMESYEMANFTTALTGFTQADQTDPATSTRLVQPSAQVPPGSVPTYSVPNCTYPSSLSDNCVETGTPGTPSAAATAAFKAIKGLAAGIQPSCVSLGGYVSAANVGGPATTALASAVSGWNTTGVPVNWTTTAPSSGTPAQSPDVTVSASSSQTANFTVTMPCNAPDTITLGSGFTSYSAPVQELIMNQALGALMGLIDTPVNAGASVMDSRSVSLLSAGLLT